MNKQTAVEWLKKNLPSIFQDDSGHYQKLFDQAKEMEKEQIIKASEEAFNSTTEYYRDGALDSEAPLFGELYYNETYGE
jgi:hypothetical protein